MLASVFQFCMASDGAFSRVDADDKSVERLDALTNKESIIIIGLLT